MRILTYPARLNIAIYPDQGVRDLEMEATLYSYGVWLWRDHDKCYSLYVHNMFEYDRVVAHLQGDQRSEIRDQRSEAQRDLRSPISDLSIPIENKFVTFDKLVREFIEKGDIPEETTILSCGPTVTIGTPEGSPAWYTPPPPTVAFVIDKDIAPRAAATLLLEFFGKTWCEKLRESFVDLNWPE